MFWVLCTSCFSRPSPETRRKFFITNCGHLLCDQCVNREHPMCRQCSAACKLVPCNAEMPSEIKEIFSDPADRISTLNKTDEYQAGQRGKFMSYLRSTVAKYKMAKSLMKELESKNVALQQQNESLKSKCASLENHIEELNKKISWYTKKCSSSKSSHYQPPFPQMAFIESSHNLTQGFDMPPQTPANDNRMNYTPYSSRTGSSKHTPFLNLYGNGNSSRPNIINTFTPPSETIELLSHINKSRRHF